MSGASDEDQQRFYGVARKNRDRRRRSLGWSIFVTVSATAEGTTIERGGVAQVLGGLTADDTIFGGEENVQFRTAHVPSGGTTVAI